MLRLIIGRPSPGGIAQAQYGKRSRTAPFIVACAWILHIDGRALAMRTFPKSRIDALTDGIFAFAMTLLVLEIRLPPGLPIKSSADLIAHLQSLWPEYLAYMISFFVLGAQWRSIIELRHAGEDVPYATLRWSITYLFFITGVPFVSSVVGHYGDMAAAVWLYAANMIIVGALSLPLRQKEIAPEHDLRARISRAKTLVFMATALGSILISLVEPGYAMTAYLLNILGGPVCERWYKPRSLN